MKEKEKKITDVMLLESFKKGSIDSFEEILHRYETKVFNLAIRFTRNQEDAEEVLQDVFSTLYRKADSFQGKSAFSSWLYRITVNAAFMKLRKRKQNQTISLEDLTPSAQNNCLEREVLCTPRVETISSNQELRDILQTAISKLPTQYRAVFLLRDVDGLSNQEVGEILELSIPAVKSRLHRSRLMLRKRLQRFYEEFSGQQLRDKRIVEIDDDVAFAA
jgi:RNA polymerase sigma-70 factor (ECF subfamily)